MIVDELKTVLSVLDDENRFFRIEGEKTLWFYDSFTHSLYTADSYVIKELKRGSHGGVLLNLSIDESFKLFSLSRTLQNSKKDIIPELKSDKKCFAMINTSNRCNLNCLYCYRNRKDSEINTYKTIKSSMDYVIEHYKPGASEYVFSFSMTSESSVDLGLLKQILNEYCDSPLIRKEKPFITMWFMTNGTCVKKEFIDFVKKCKINPLWVSIDGPQKIHDYNRKYRNGKGSYSEVINNIKEFQRNGINLKASVVLTSRFPKPLEIINHILSLGFVSMSMTPVRPGTECSFNDNNIVALLEGYDEVFEELKITVLNGDYKLFKILREDMILSSFYTFVKRIKKIKRCAFDEQLVIDSKGNIYPCLYFTGNKDFCLGNIKNGIDYRKIDFDIYVTHKEKCSLCWARYLCGGTCFYSSYKTCGNYKATDPIECKIKKHLAIRCLQLVVFFKEHNISFESFLFEQ
ncbi:MAG: SPASM domain-containing protein [Treponema sp.]|nr:SPASM domain-containing protein [Treponema sp.]